MREPVKKSAGPEYSGTVLADLSEERELLIEFGRGLSGARGRNKFVFFEKDGTSYFNDNEVELEHSAWLLRLTEQVLALKGRYGARCLRAGFVVSGQSIRLARARPAREGIAPDDLLFKFENECRYNYHYTDFSDSAANAILKRLGLSRRFRSEIKEGELFLRYSVLGALENELKEKAGDPAFAAGFYGAYLNFILYEARRAKEIGGGPPLALLSRLKQLNFKLSVYNYLSTRVLRFALERLAPEQRGAAAGRGAYSETLRKLTALQNTVNARISVISSAYAERIAGPGRKFAGLDVPKACKLPGAAIGKILKKKHGAAEMDRLYLKLYGRKSAAPGRFSRTRGRRPAGRERTSAA